jgi:hypothetical protein
LGGGRENKPERELGPGRTGEDVGASGREGGRQGAGLGSQVGRARAKNLRGPPGDLPKSCTLRVLREGEAKKLAKGERAIEPEKRETQAKET